MEEDDFDVPNAADDSELGLPKSTVHRLVNEMMPEDITCTKETKDLLMDCCLEFVHLLSAQANEICDKDGKKTITGDHIVQALQELGMPEFVEGVKEQLKDHQQTSKEERTVKKSKKKEKNSGMSEEELAAAQEALFNQAKQKYLSQAPQTPITPITPAIPLPIPLKPKKDE